MERVTVALSDDLRIDLDVYCRNEHVTRDEAIRRLLADWLEHRSPDGTFE